MNRTPGDWTAKAENDYVPAQVWTDDGRLLCEVFGESREIRKVNANLMAASPKLYRQLELANVNIATAHAEGQVDNACAFSVDTCPCALATNWRNNRDALKKARGEA